MKRGNRVILGTVALAAAVLGAPPVRAVDDLSFIVAPGSERVFPGDTVTVTLDVTSVSTSINGVQVLFQYDVALLSLIDVVPVGVVGPPAEGWFEVDETDNAGEVTWAAVINGGSIQVDHSVATLTFTAIAEGTTTVAFRGDVAPFFTKLTAAAGSTTIFPNTTDSPSILVTCDDGTFCNGLETFNGVGCDPGTDPCTPLVCDEVNDVCLPAPRVSNVELYYTGKFSDQADPSRAFLAVGSVADATNATSYVHGITGVRIFLDDFVVFATTAQDALTFEWTTGTGTSFTPVTNAATAITVTASAGVSGTVIDVVLTDDHVQDRWLKITIDALQVSSSGVTMDGELSGNPLVLPSGDGNAGGDAVLFIGNLGGEVDGNQKTTLTDVGVVRADVNPFFSVSITEINDVDKDGKVLLTDVGDVRANVNPFFTLPLIAP